MRSHGAQEAGGALADKMTGHGDLLKPTKNPQNIENEVTEVKMGLTTSKKIRQNSLSKNEANTLTNVPFGQRF